MKKNTPNLLNEYNRLFGGSNRNLLKEMARNDLHKIADDRTNIAAGNTQDPDDGAYYQFIFDPEDMDAMEAFEEDVKKLLDKENLRYEMSEDGNLRLWDEDADLYEREKY